MEEGSVPTSTARNLSFVAHITENKENQAPTHSSMEIASKVGTGPGHRPLTWPDAEVFLGEACRVSGTDEPGSWVGTPGEGKGLCSEIKLLLSSDSYLVSS